MSSKVPIVQSIGQMAATQPSAPAMTWLNDQIKPELSLTYKDLWEAAGAIADKLTSTKIGMKPGQNVILCFPFGLEFMVAMIGCMRAGVVAVSVYPPDPKNLDRGLPKLAALVEDSESEVALTTHKYKRIVKATKFAGKKWPRFKSWVSVDLQLGKNYKRVREDHNVQLDDLCFVQYTSGSTGAPKGVMVAHGNVAHNTAYLADQQMQGLTLLTWMPKYHDYALVNELANLTVGGHCISMSPITFIRQPLCWLTAIEKYKPQLTMGPTFSYKLAIKRLRQALADGKLAKCPDMSSLHTAGISAEPIDEQTLKDILENFGISSSVLKPAYGMAEVCVKATIDSGVHFDPITRIPSSGDMANARKWDMTFVIADRKTLTPLPDGTTGTIYISGPSVVPGYYRLQDLNHERFGIKLEGIESATFFDTQDLGFIRNGRLFINGRFKDLIIINGSNKYPQDIERLVEDHPLLSHIVRPGCSAAFQIELDSFGYIGELRPGAEVNEAATAEVRRLLEEEFGKCDAFGLYPKGTVPKTTSGKVRRSEAAKLFKSGMLNNSSLTDTSRPVSNMHELLTKYGVEDFKLTLVESGVDSLRLTRLVDEAFNVLNVTIDPASIASVPAERLGSLDSTTSPEMPRIPTAEKYSGRKMFGSELFQLLGIGLVILTFVASTIPAYYYWCLVRDVIAPEYPMALTTFDGGPGFLVHGVVVAWMFSFSFAVVIMKWLIIGKYREGSHTLWSPYFCRWWLVDRFLHVWETYVGGLTLSTPWGNIFYMLLGAKIHPSARLGSFIREHDLFTAGERTQISGMVHCRLVDARGLILKKTVVLRGSRIKVSDVVYPGTVQNTDALSHSGQYIQRLISPFILFAAYAGAFVFASFLTSLGGRHFKAFVRLPVCAIIAHFAVMAFAAILQRINVLIEYFYDSPIDVLIDSLASTAENYLAPFTVRSVFPILFAKLFGANITITTELGKFSAIISPSKARFLTAGAHSNLSVCVITPSRLQPVRVGKGAAIGRCAHLQAGCYVQDGASISTNAIVAENATVAGAFFSEEIELTRRDKAPKKKGWISKLRLFLTDSSVIGFPLLLRVVFAWAPLLCIFGSIIYTIPYLNAHISSLVPMLLRVPILFLYSIACTGLTTEIVGAFLGLVLLPSGGASLHLKNPRVWLFTVYLTFSLDCFVYILPFIAGSWIFNLRLSTLGAKFSGGIFSAILMGVVADYPLIRIGNGAVLERAAMLYAHHMEHFRLDFAEAEIGNNSSIHPMSYVMGGDRIGDNVTLAMRSQCKFTPGGIIRANKSGVFVGVPAIEVDCAQDESVKFMACPNDSTTTLLNVSSILRSQSNNSLSSSNTSGQNKSLSKNSLYSSNSSMPSDSSEDTPKSPASLSKVEGVSRRRRSTLVLRAV